jgi:hypothetical protein
MIPFAAKSFTGKTFAQSERTDTTVPLDVLMSLNKKKSDYLSPLRDYWPLPGNTIGRQRQPPFRNDA